MRIVVASGKGGTGKTTVAVNLAAFASESGCKTHLLDCDVEQPNCHLFLEPEISRSETVYLPVPVVETGTCRGHGTCADFCEFNALACIDGKVLVFNELCHGCKGCQLVCPANAINMGQRKIGVLEEGFASKIQFSQGRLRVGEAMAVPLIERVISTQNGSALSILDSPPGTSCPVVSTIREGDFVLLVTEPTPFGLHDLELAVSTATQLRRPFGVVINRAGSGDDRVRRFCRDNKIPILLEIPEDRRIAEAYSRGILSIDAVPESRKLYNQLYHRIHAWCRRSVA